MKLLGAIWLPLTFTIVCSVLIVYSYMFTILAFFGMADTISRYKDYKRLLTKGIRQGTIKIMKYSRCQRNVVVSICKEAKEYYYSLGYRWYHILPDGTFTLHSNPYLTKKFYINLVYGLGFVKKI